MRTSMTENASQSLNSETLAPAKSLNLKPEILATALAIETWRGLAGKPAVVSLCLTHHRAWTQSSEI